MHYVLNAHIKFNLINVARGQTNQKYLNTHYIVLQLDRVRPFWACEQYSIYGRGTLNKIVRIYYFLINAINCYFLINE